MKGHLEPEKHTMSVEKGHDVLCGFWLSPTYYTGARARFRNVSVSHTEKSDLRKEHGLWFLAERLVHTTVIELQK